MMRVEKVVVSRKEREIGDVIFYRPQLNVQIGRNQSVRAD